MQFSGLKRGFSADWEGLIANIGGKGELERVYNIELFHDAEIADAIVERFGLASDIDRGGPDYERKKMIALNRFCGLDYVTAGLAVELSFHRQVAEDTAGLKRAGGREFQDSHTGPIMSWADFEDYSWPDVESESVTQELQWYQENLPDDMCIIGGLTGHFCEEVTWLMGYERFCFALYEEPDLVDAIAAKLRDFYIDYVRRLLEFDRVKAVWASDDMGFKTGLLFSAEDMRRLVLDNHKVLAQMCHDAGRLYLLHSCGRLDEIMDYLINDVKIDAKHSFEDTIEDVRDVKAGYGRKIALLGCIDVDFLCRSDEAAIRKRVRETLDICQAGGRFCLGTGNTVANYIPLDNYLAMIDEGRLYCS